MKVTIELNKAGIVADAGKRLKRAQLALDQQIAKDSNYYAPEDKGDLKDSVFTSAAQGLGKLVWSVEYSRRLYYGIGFNFSKDKNPNARAKWVEAAKAVRMKEWEKVANNEYRK